MSAYRWVGTPTRRVDGEAKVRGSLVFPSDVEAPGLYHCRPVLAPYPHARLLGVDTAPALAVPGVVRVLTHQDVPGSNRYGYRHDHPVLCDDKLRYSGDMVAVVVAETGAAAEQGARLVEVRYEPLPLVTDPEAALAGQGPQVHAGGNILHEIHYQIGDVESVLADPGVVVVEQVFCPQAMDHAFLETEAGVAFPEAGGVRVVSGGQNAYYDRDQVAQALGLPTDLVRMVEPYSGGAFGGKGDITVQIVVALAAYLTGHPCRMQWTRPEHFRAGVKRHAARIQMRAAADRAGDLLALSARLVADTGAYAVFGDSILEVMAEAISGAYRIPNIHVDAWAVFTNNLVSGAFRGFGATQATVAIEGAMSELARRIGMDPIEFRLRNAVTQGDWAGAGHHLMLPVGVKQGLQTAHEHPLWQRRGQLPRCDGPVRRGIGMAVSMKGFGLGCNDMPDYSAATASLTSDGRLFIQTGIVELGQGSHTAMVQIAAEAFGCGPEFIDFQAADTREDPDAGTTAAQRVTYSVGRAVRAAAEELGQQVRHVAATHWQVPLEQVSLADGVVWDCQTENQLSLAGVAALASQPLQVCHRQRLPFSDYMAGGHLAHPHILYSSHTLLAQVAVDAETGDIRVEEIVSFPEAGQVINPLGLEGQCEGGVAQGIGYALMEKVVVQEGVVLNPDLTRYPVPTVMDIPPIKVIPVQIPETSGPFGAKGIAENATLPVAPAILDAIADAIGIRFTAMPVTPERVLEALADRQAFEKRQEE